MTAKRKTIKPPVIDMAAPLPDRILAAMAGHDSKHPARSVDIAALVGADEAAYLVALKALLDQRSVNCAHVLRKGDAAPWLAIWPTGVRVKGQRADRIYDPTASAPAPVAFAARDGGLAICDGNGLLNVPFSDLPRLAQTLAAMGYACGAPA